MDEIIDSELVEAPKAKPRIFSIQEIMVGAFLGGSIAGGYFLAHNFKVFGEFKKANITWLISIATLVLLFFLVFQFTFLDNIPNQVFTFGVAGGFYAAAQHYQSDSIDNYLKNGGTTASWMRVIGISIAFMAILIVLIFGYVYYSDPIISATSKTYGPLNHELNYDDNYISEQEADDIAAALTYGGYFGEEQQGYAYLTEKNEKNFIILPLLKDAYKDPEVIQYYEWLQKELEEFTQDEIVIGLCEDDITIINKEIE